MSSDNTIETSQITTGLGQDAYNTFRQYFHGNDADDYGTQILVLKLSALFWTICVIYLYYLLIGEQTGTDDLQAADRRFLYAFSIIVAYPYLQYLSRYLRLIAGLRQQSRYTGQSNMTPHCTQSLLELDSDLQKAGIVGTVDFKCRESVRLSQMAAFDDLSQRSYYLATALLMIIIYLLTQGRETNIITENNPFLVTAVRIALLTGITTMVVSGFSAGDHGTQILKSIPDNVYIMQGASVFIVISFILNRSISLK